MVVCLFACFLTGKRGRVGFGRFFSLLKNIVQEEPLGKYENKNKKQLKNLHNLRVVENIFHRKFDLPGIKK